MSKIGFIGVGNMGGPMACNLVKAGHEVTAFDLSEDLLNQVKDRGALVAKNTASAVAQADVVITMLPAGAHVKQVYLDDILPSVPQYSLLIDCSTIDVATARLVHEEARVADCLMVDAPVSGGVSGATAATLTFMVGGSVDAFEQAETVIKSMGKNAVHCGAEGTGQAAKACNNMMLGIQMASVVEGFLLADSLGLEADKLFEVASTASSQCWSLTTYCPVPGPVETSPANNNYQPGFATALMLKDMKLALDAASLSGVSVGVAERAAELYQEYSDQGNAGKDFSGIMEMIRDKGDSSKT